MLSLGTIKRKAFRKKKFELILLLYDIETSEIPGLIKVRYIILSFLSNMRIFFICLWTMMLAHLSEACGRKNKKRFQSKGSNQCCNLSGQNGCCCPNQSSSSCSNGGLNVLTSLSNSFGNSNLPSVKCF